jgi:hypothetical protein
VAAQQTQGVIALPVADMIAQDITPSFQHLLIQELLLVFQFRIRVPN